MPQLTINLLGFPRVSYDDDPIELNRRKAMALLAYIAVNPQEHSRDTLAAILWDELDDQRARNELRRALVVLNKTPIADYLDVDRKTIMLREDDAVWVDVQQFTTLLEGNPTLTDLEKAIDLYQDHFMVGFTLRDSATFDDWQSMQMQTYQQQFIAALEQLVTYQINAQEVEPAIDSLNRWLEIDPLYEPAQRQLMRAYTVAGQRAAALHQYETYIALLEKELATQPQDETVKLYDAIKANRPVRLEEYDPPVFGNLPPLPALVVGREGALNALKTRLHIQGDPPRDSRRVHIVQGWPGIGKTTLSSLLAHDADVHKHFTDGVLWTSLGEHPNIFSELSNWAYALGLDDLNGVNTVDDLSSRLAAALRDRQMLLIVDDIWNPAHLRPFNIGGRQCATLITTRLNEVAQALATSHDDIYKIPILTVDDSVDLMRRLAPQVVDENPDAIRELVTDLEGLPLALQVSGRLLRAERNMGWGVDDLLRDLREGARLLEAQAPADRADVATAVTPTIATLLRYSTDHLTDEMQEKFAMLGVFAPKPATFDLDAMQAVWLVDDPRPVTRTLVDRGLLEPLSGGRFQMHALLVAHAKSMFEG